MNIFIIPSWFPSKTDPFNGIFILEQTLWMAEHHPDINFGIGTWGQNDEDHLLYIHEPFRSLRKAFNKKKEYEKKLRENVFLFFQPAFSWSSKINKGNIGQKIKACRMCLEKFERIVGKADVIHAHVSYPGGYIARQISHGSGIPYLITEHMAPFPQIHHVSNGKLKKDVKHAIEDAHLLLAVSRYTLEEMKVAGVKKDIHILPNYHQRSRDHMRPVKKREKFTYITVCGLHVNKGLPELLEAIRIAVSSDPGLNFVIIGDGPHRSLLEERIDQLQIGAFVELTGSLSREQTLELYDEVHAHILTSHYESFGVVYVEAMAAGLPSIANPVGGPLDILDDTTGVFVESLSPQDISGKILWLKQNIHIFRKDEIRRVFEARFSAKKVTHDLGIAYRRLAAANRNYRINA